MLCWPCLAQRLNVAKFLFKTWWCKIFPYWRFFRKITWTSVRNQRKRQTSSLPALHNSQERQHQRGGYFLLCVQRRADVGIKPPIIIQKTQKQNLTTCVRFRQLPLKHLERKVLLQHQTRGGPCHSMGFIWPFTEEKASACGDNNRVRKFFPNAPGF